MWCDLEKTRDFDSVVNDFLEVAIGLKSWYVLFATFLGTET